VPRWDSGINRILSFLFWSVLFGVTYTQAPLYYSNQNQYFLHGLAQAGLGNLDQDWLANTADPTPVFSALVAFTYRQHIDVPILRRLHEYLFYCYYILILGLYFHSLVGIARFCEPALNDKPLARLGFITLFVVIHAGILRLASATLFGVDYPWYFQAGVAGQYILGFGLQPSVFGVFLLASINAFLRNRPWLAATLACLAGIVHSTYLLGAAMLILAYQIILLRDKQIKKAVLLGLWALVLVLPVVIYNLIAFAPTSREIFAEAQRILAHFRIPHHAEVARWLDGIALAQVAWMIAAIFLVRKTKLCLIMIVVFTLSLLLTLIQVATDNDTLALLFPWRTSAVLVPLATTIILARLVGAWSRRTGSKSYPRLCRALCWPTLAVFFAGGLVISFLQLGYRTNPDEVPFLAFVRQEQENSNIEPPLHGGLRTIRWFKGYPARGWIFLLPVDFPKGIGPKGAASTNFTPAPRAGKSGHPIAIYLQRFRIVTGTPIYVDFKSIPYRDTDVMEWHERLRWAKNVYTEQQWNEQKTLKEFAERGITHVVTTRKQKITGSAWERVFEDPNYGVYILSIPRGKGGVRKE
jgi:hypothetical protein